MGKAVIIENRREGLYRIKLLYNNRPLEAALAKAQTRKIELDEKLTNSWLTLRAIQRDAVAAMAAMNAVVEQYVQGRLDALKPPPVLEPPTGIDPETGQPWVNPDRAQDQLLLDAINTTRIDAGKPAITRSEALDTAALKHLQDCTFSRKISHFGPSGTTPENRVSRAGYAFDATLGVAELLAAGPSSAPAAVADWLRNGEDRAALLAEATEVGVAFVYSTRSPYAYHWAAVLAKPGTALAHQIKTDPVKAAKENVDEHIKTIQTPVTDQLPQQLAQTCANAAQAARKVRVAEETLAKIKLEQIELAERIATLEQAGRAGEQVIDAWCCIFFETLPVGVEVDVAEVPGFWEATHAANRTAIMGVRNDQFNTIPDTTVFYIERRINIVPPWLRTEFNVSDFGQLQYADVLSDAGLLYNLLLEPAHLRYKPLFRYGTISSRGGGDIATTVTLEPIPARRLPGDPALALDAPEQTTIHNVPIYYPECHGSVFSEGDDVLIMYAEHDRDQPKIVGFRREPKKCAYQRVWIERV